MNHDLLMTKLGAYGFRKDTRFFMKNYLMKRQQRAHVNSKFSTWERKIFRVPQGSILQPPLFNIFLNNLFLFVENSNLSYHTDGNTLYCSGNNFEHK